MTILNQNMETKQYGYTDTDSFIIYIITEDFYEDIANDVKRWFDTSNHDENKTGKKLLPIGINKKVIGLFKDELRIQNLLELDQEHTHI